MAAQNASSARTPVLWRKALKKLEIDAVIEVRDINCQSPIDLRNEINNGEYQAVILGHPNKLYATALVAHTNVKSEKSGLNLMLLRKNLWEGFNFDGIAFYLSLYEEFASLIDKSVFLFLGTGSTANSCSTEIMAQKGRSSIHLLPRSKFDSSIDEIFLSLGFSNEENLHESFIVINCTPMGKADYQIPKNIKTLLEILNPELFYDVNYYLNDQSYWSELTQLKVVRDGKKMNLIQAALGFHQVFLQEVMSPEDTLKFFQGLN